MDISFEDVSEYVEGWHKYGDYGMGICPFHDDHSPSMMVTARGYYCKSCGSAGSLNKLYQKLYGTPFTRSRPYNPSVHIWKRLNEEFGDIKTICKIAHTNLMSNMDLGDYLFKRGLSKVAIKLGHIGFLGGYYIFPVMNKYGDVHGAVGRASPTIQTKDTRYSVSFGCPLKLYIPDWDAVEKSETVYVCYGTLDAWSLQLAGYPAITGISGQELNAGNLSGFRKRMFGISDKGEEISMRVLQGNLGWRMSVLRIDYPDGCKDVNDIHVKFGLEKLNSIVDHARESFYA